MARCTIFSQKHCNGGQKVFGRIVLLKDAYKCIGLDFCGKSESLHKNAFGTVRGAQLYRGGWPGVANYTLVTQGRLFPFNFNGCKFLSSCVNTVHFVLHLREFVFVLNERLYAPLRTAHTF